MPFPTPVDHIDVLLNSLPDQGLQCYALIDGTAGNRTVVEKTYESGLTYFPLYLDTDYEPIIAVSPLLVQLEQGHPFAGWLCNSAPFLHEGMGVLLASSLPRKQVIAHLQSLTEVKLPSLNFAAFRYYDARVLHTFAYGTEEKNLQRFTGPLEYVFWPYFRKRDQAWLWFSLSGNPALVEEAPFPLPVLEISDDDLTAFETINTQEQAMRIDALFADR